MSDTNLTTGDGDTDKSIIHGSYRIDRVGASIRLNDNDSQFEDDKTELAVGSSPDDVGSPPGILLQATFNNGGYLDAYTGLTMTPAQARDVAEALQDAADAYDQGREGWFR